MFFSSVHYFCLQLSAGRCEHEEFRAGQGEGRLWGWQWSSCLSGKGEKQQLPFFWRSWNPLLAFPLGCREGEEEEEIAVILQL